MNQRWYAGFHEESTAVPRRCSECHKDIPAMGVAFVARWTNGRKGSKWVCSKDCLDAFEAEFFGALADEREGR